MTRTFSRGWRVAALLAGLLIVVAASGSLDAYSDVLDSDLALVPADAAAFLTVRAASLTNKLEPTDGAAKKPWATVWQQHVGLPLSNVERCTLVSPSAEPNSNATCLIIRTLKPYKNDDVLQVCVPDAKQVKIHKKICYVSATMNAAVHFVNDHLLLVGDTEAVKKCLAANEKTLMGPSIKEALTLAAAKHDAVLWCRGVAIPNGGYSPPMRSAIPVSSFKLPSTTAPAQARAVTVARKPKRDVEEDEDEDQAPRPENQTVMMGFLPVPLPHGVEAGTVVVDVADKLTIEFRVNCADETSAGKTAKVMQAIVGLMRAELLTAVSGLDLAEAYPAMVDGADRRPLPTTLLRQAEKGMQTVRVRTEGKVVPVTITIPIDAKTLRSELATCCPNGNCCALPFPSTTWMQGNCLMGGPSYGYAPPAPAIDTPITPGTYVPSPYYPTPPCSPPPATPAVIAPSTWTGPVGTMPPTPQLPPTPAALPPSTVPPTPRVVPTVATPPAAPTFEVKLTIANVRKETALLFTMADNGKLTFCTKVSAGDAVDVQTTSGQRWVAVFVENPASETFTANQPSATWLLRCEASAVSTYPVPNSPGWVRSR